MGLPHLLCYLPPIALLFNLITLAHAVMYERPWMGKLIRSSRIPTTAGKQTYAQDAFRNPNDLSFIPLTTERLTLRPLQPSDAEALHRLINDWEVTRTLAEIPYPYPRDLADEWIAAATKKIAEGSAYHLAITGQEGDKEILIGAVGLCIDFLGRTGRLGYWVGRAYWGHGVATEASRRLTSWALANLPIDRIVSDVMVGNDASVAVLRRIGFRQIGSAEKKLVTNGQANFVTLFEATRHDFFDHQRTLMQLPIVPESKPLLMVVACALVDADGRVLLARRPEGKRMAGLWEFPGGKLNAGETPETAMIRELKEEIGIDVQAACIAPFTFASHDYDTFHLLMPLFVCRRWKGIPTSRENQTLAWVCVNKLTDYEMPPADKPLIPLLRDFL